MFAEVENGQGSEQPFKKFSRTSLERHGELHHRLTLKAQFEQQIGFDT